MRYLLFLSIIAMLSSCSDTFVNHDLKVEKLGDCAAKDVKVGIISNINGERYEFQECLDENFDGKNYNVERKGDSLIVKFPAAAAKTALFKLTLDIDAKPAYHMIILGTHAGIPIVATEK